jgi:hypothetical protein
MNLNILKDLAADLNDFEAQVRERVARAAASAPTGASTQPSAGLRFYHSDPLEEDTNALGHLADPWSVVRVTAHVSNPVACGLTGPSLDAQGELWDARPSCLAIVRLGGGDQTVVFPTPYAATWLPKPGVHELKLLKRAVPNVPSDALVVQHVGVSRTGPAATPWLLDHLGLPDRLEFDLHRVLASMKPVHQAVFVAAVSRPDIEHKLTAAVAAPEPHTLSSGIRAAMGLNVIDLNRDEASLARLACLISDLGALQDPGASAGSDGSGSLLPEQEAEVADTRRAHPHTATFLGALLGRFAELEPQDAADLLGLLGEQAHRPFRIGSKDGGPFSDRPADPVLARMGCAMGDALSQARATMAREMDEVLPTPVDNGGELSEQTEAGMESQTSVPPAAHLEVSDSFDVAEALDDLVAQQGTNIDEADGATPIDGGVDIQGGEEGDSSSNALAVIPNASLVPSADDLRLDLERFNDLDDAPRPSLEWAAGMLDGDGCIAIVKQPYPDRNPIYRLTVSVCQNCLQTLEHFRRSVGVDGVIYAVKRKLEHNKQVYTLNYSGPRALLVIRRLRAFLVRKRPEAMVAISFCLNGQISRRFGPHGVPTDVEAVRVAHYLKLRALK